MAIISNDRNFYKIHFIFSENDILLIDNQLPDGNFMNKLLDNQIVSDWFSEPSYEYSALMLEKDCALPANCCLIPLREYFHINTDNPSMIFLSARAHSLLRQREQYRFCPTCGGKLKDDSLFTAKKCALCQRQFFPRLEPAVIVLVSKGDEVLLVKSKTTASDKFSCIAGFIEAGETAEQCVRREVAEETGIQIKNIKYKGSQSWPFPDQLMLAFTAEFESGTVKLQDSEIVEGGWYKKDSLPKHPLPGSAAWNLLLKDL